MKAIMGAWPREAGLGQLFLAVLGSSSKLVSLKRSSVFFM